MLYMIGMEWSLSGSGPSPHPLADGGGRREGAHMPASSTEAEVLALAGEGAECVSHSHRRALRVWHDDRRFCMRCFSRAHRSES